MHQKRLWEISMFIVSVMYPSGFRFDGAYYGTTHAQLVNDRWKPFGLRDLQVLRGQSGPDGSNPTYTVVANLMFDTRAAFEAAASEHAAEIFADIPNFTDATPIVQLSETA